MVQGGDNQDDYDGKGDGYDCDKNDEDEDNNDETGGPNKTDEFSEKFQTALDRLPHFGKIMLQFSYNFMVKGPS